MSGTLESLKLHKIGDRIELLATFSGYEDRQTRYASACFGTGEEINNLTPVQVADKLVELARIVATSQEINEN